MSGGGGGSEPPKSYRYKYYVSFAVLLSENPLASIEKIFENGKLIYENGDTGNKRWESMTFYDGTQTAADSLIQAKEGIDATPAHIGYSYVVFENYELENAGNSIPNMEFIVKEKISKTVSQTITDILLRSGVDISQISVSPALAATQMLGYVSSGPVSTRKLLKDIILTFDVLQYEYNGVLYFKERSNIPQYTLDPKYLSAKDNNEGEDEESAKLIITNLDQRTFPKEISLKYPDTTKELQWGSQSEIKQNNASFINKVLNQEVEVTMTPTQARTRCNTLLWQKWNENKTVSFKLGPNQFLIQEADIIQITLEQQQYIIRIETVTTGANYITECQGVVVGLTESSMESPYFGQNIPALDSVFEPQELYIIPDLAPYIIDCGPLRFNDEKQSLVYTGQSISNGNEFLGATIYKALGAVEPYTATRATTLQTTSGVIITTLPDFDGYGWDRNNTFTVQLNYGTLISRDESEVLQGANWAVIDDEVIGFSTALLIDADVYEISNLIRARRGTESNSHTIGERFVLLNTSEIETYPQSASDYNSVRYYKWVPSGEDVTNVTPINHNYQARTLREFKPINFTGVRESNNDWTFDWLRHTRTLWSPLSNTIQPAPDGRHYGVKIYSGDEVIRTIDIINTETATYTEAMQIADTGGIAYGVTAGVVQYNDEKGLEGIENKLTF